MKRLDNQPLKDEVLHPNTIDVSLTGSCQLDCAWCWSEKPAISTVRTSEEWTHLLTKFNHLGTNGVVFNGREPLMASHLPEVVRHAKERLDMRTTLSTNAILLARRHQSVLPYIDDLGLPLDGPNSKINKRMRAGKIDNFQKVIDGAKLVLDTYPETELTIRTVIARPNIEHVADIPDILKEQGIDLTRIRHKLYQVEPIGPRAAITDAEEWYVDEAECRVVSDEITKRHPELNSVLQLYRTTSGRYYQIDPRGNAYGTDIDENGRPRTIELGNPVEDFDHAIGLLAIRYAFQSTH